MIQTAIIAFLLIGAMFIFTECGDSEAKKVTKVEVDKEGIPKYVTAKSHDNSYSERDSEMAVASYKKEEESNGSLKYIDDGLKYSLASKERPHKTDTSAKGRDDEIPLASYATKGMVTEEVVEAVLMKEEVPADEEVTVEENVTVEEAVVLDENVSDVEVNESVVPDANILFQMQTYRFQK